MSAPALYLTSSQRSALDAGFAATFGTAPERYFSAPGRTEADLRSAWGRCVLIADSLHEVDMIRKIAAEKGETPEIGVRINPCDGFRRHPHSLQGLPHVHRVSGCPDPCGRRGEHHPRPDSGRGRPLRGAGLPGPWL